MRKFLDLSDGETVELPPLTYHEFVALDRWIGGSDMAYEQWLSKNGYIDPDCYCVETLYGARLRLVNEASDPTKLLFCVDGKTWKHVPMETPAKNMSRFHGGPCVHLKRSE